ncbi:MAG: hypothetical protein EZS28_023749 [Streblomastix strix]|uniref:BIG2 domain-containing protein n=1 Tax=Streblomastix strix TaxID=222440 RepID=A0A5J4VE22_9EUKA|nr:MAG: hypothetical protein EZS28_023749 [Streblomastix strix]
MKKSIVSFLLLILGVSLIACELTPITVTIKDAPASSLRVGNTHQLSASITPDASVAAGVSWSSSDAEIASISESGLISALAIGSAEITATHKADATKSNTISITIIAQYEDAESIVISGPSEVIIGHGSYRYTAAVTPAGANPDPVWSVENESIATILPSGMLSGKVVGNTKVIGTLGDIVAEYPISVILPADTAAYYDELPEYLYIGDSVEIWGEIWASSTDLNLAISYSSSDSDIASIAKVGGSYILTGKAAGSVTIRFYATAYPDIYDEAEILIVDPAVSANALLSTLSALDHSLISNDEDDLGIGRIYSTSYAYLAYLAVGKPASTDLGYLYASGSWHGITYATDIWDALGQFYFKADYTSITTAELEAKKNYSTGATYDYQGDGIIYYTAGALLDILNKIGLHEYLYLEFDLYEEDGVSQIIAVWEDEEEKEQVDVYNFTIGNPAELAELEAHASFDYDGWGSWVITNYENFFSNILAKLGVPLGALANLPAIADEQYGYKYYKGTSAEILGLSQHSWSIDLNVKGATSTSAAAYNLLLKDILDITLKQNATSDPYYAIYEADGLSIVAKAQYSTIVIRDLAAIPTAWPESVSDYPALVSSTPHANSVSYGTLRIHYNYIDAETNAAALQADYTAILLAAGWTWTISEQGKQLQNADHTKKVSYYNNTYSNWLEITFANANTPAVSAWPSAAIEAGLGIALPAPAHDANYVYSYYANAYYPWIKIWFSAPYADATTAEALAIAYSLLLNGASWSIQTTINGAKLQDSTHAWGITYTANAEYLLITLNEGVALATNVWPAAAISAYYTALETLLKTTVPALDNNDSVYLFGYNYSSIKIIYVNDPGAGWSAEYDAYVAKLEALDWKYVQTNGGVEFQDPTGAWKLNKYYNESSHILELSFDTYTGSELPKIWPSAQLAIKWPTLTAINLPEITGLGSIYGYSYSASTDSVDLNIYSSLFIGDGASDAIKAALASYLLVLDGQSWEYIFNNPYWNGVAYSYLLGSIQISFIVGYNNLSLHIANAASTVVGRPVYAAWPTATIAALSASFPAPADGTYYVLPEAAGKGLYKGKIFAALYSIDIDASAYATLLTAQGEWELNVDHYELVADGSKQIYIIEHVDGYAIIYAVAYTASDDQALAYGLVTTLYQSIRSGSTVAKTVPIIEGSEYQVSIGAAIAKPNNDAVILKIVGIEEDRAEIIALFLDEGWSHVAAGNNSTEYWHISGLDNTGMNSAWDLMVDISEVSGGAVILTFQIWQFDFYYNLFTYWHSSQGLVNQQKPSKQKTIITQKSETLQQPVREFLFFVQLFQRVFSTSLSFHVRSISTSPMTDKMPFRSRGRAWMIKHSSLVFQRSSLRSKPRC